jgi:CRP-like cAMP-binding protein
VTATDPQRVQRELYMRSLFPAMPAAGHARFIELLQDLEVSEGETLFSIGELADRFFFVVTGNVVMERPGAPLWPFGPLSVVGMIDAILERPRVRSCRSLSACKLLSMRAADWFDMLEDNAQIARGAIRNFAAGLHNRSREGVPSLVRTRTSDPPPHDFDVNASTYDRIVALRRAPLLGRAGMQAVASLASIAEPKHVGEGELLFDVGSDDGMLAIVARGRLELRDEMGLRALHGPGDLVGGAAALCGALSLYSARGVAESVVLRIHEQDFYDQAEEHARLTRGTLAYLVSELDRVIAADGERTPGGR